jgi:formate-dependent nitrite reductase membrane component NrfD
VVEPGSLTELIVTRSNHLVDPVLHVWAWQIPVYLFLGGWVAGMMVLTAWLLKRRVDSGDTLHTSACTWMPWLGIVLLTLGMVALFLDLEHKPYVWRLYTAFLPRSPMSWGAWILVAVYPALVVAGLLAPPAWLVRLVPSVAGLSRSLNGWRPLVPLVIASNVVLGIALGIYTGILLSALGARPLWNSALLGPLFLLSGLSSAAAFVHLVARDRIERELLARADNVFLAAELVVLALYFVGITQSAGVHREAARLLLGGPYGAVFWVVVVGLGLVVPLIVQSLAVSHRVVHTPVAPLLVLAGGLALRFVIVYAGQESRWAQWLRDVVRPFV